MTRLNQSTRGRETITHREKTKNTKMIGGIKEFAKKKWGDMGNRTTRGEKEKKMANEDHIQKER